MVRRAGLTIMVLLGIWILVGCSMADREGKTMDKTEKSAVDSNGQNAADQDAAEMIRELLGCSLRTAQSIEKQCHMAGIGEIRAAEKTEDVYTILELATEDEKYYVYLADGFFLEQIRKGTEEGEKIYTAIE